MQLAPSAKVLLPSIYTRPLLPDPTCRLPARPAEQQFWCKSVAHPSHWPQPWRIQRQYDGSQVRFAAESDRLWPPSAWFPALVFFAPLPLRIPTDARIT